MFCGVHTSIEEELTTEQAISREQQLHPHSLRRHCFGYMVCSGNGRSIVNVDIIRTVRFKWNALEMAACST